ncbi:YjeF N-terminal domain-containing protein [Trichinella spiralis]|uniref:YjeF N-terminal domain-containing protein n=1 Tax=Trichinella spiralis TaxID=6334 RepID=A0ABR3L0K2_TRISP
MELRLYIKNVSPCTSAKTELRPLTLPVIKADSRDLKGSADDKKGMRQRALSELWTAERTSERLGQEETFRQGHRALPGRRPS